MTRKEAIAYGEDYLKDLISACCHIEEKHKDFVRMAIKALEQEDVLDEIRADVINIADGRQSISVRSAIKILDKYRKEV